MARSRTAVLGLLLVGLSGFTAWRLTRRDPGAPAGAAARDRAWYAEERPPPPQPHARIEDDAGLLGPFGPTLGRYADGMLEDLGVDVRVVTRSDAAAPIEKQANDTFRALKIGADAPAGGILVLIDPALHDARIEVSYALEPIYTDALVGRIARDQLAPYASYGVAGMAVLDTLHYLKDLGYVAAIRDELKLDAARRARPELHDMEQLYSGGGGAKTALATLSIDADLKQAVPEDRRLRYAPSGQCSESVEAFLRATSDLAGDPTLELFTEGSRLMRAHYPLAPFEELARSRRIEESRPLEIREEGDRAVASSRRRAHGFVPILLHRESGLWRVDLVETWKNLFFDPGGEYRLVNLNTPYAFGLAEFGGTRFLDVDPVPLEGGAESSLAGALQRLEHPMSVLALVERGEILFRNVFLPIEAMQDFEDARRLAPRDPYVLDVLARRAMYMGFWEIALPALIELGPGSELRLVEAYCGMGRLDRAERWARRALLRNPYDMQALAWLRAILLEEKQPDEAREVGARMAELERDLEGKSAPVELTFDPPRPRFETHSPVVIGGTRVFDHSEFAVTITNRSRRRVEIDSVVVESRGDAEASGLGDIRSGWTWPARPGRLEAGQSVKLRRPWGFTIDTDHTHVRYVFHLAWHGVGTSIGQCRVQSVDVLP